MRDIFKVRRPTSMSGLSIDGLPRLYIHNKDNTVTFKMPVKEGDELVNLFDLNTNVVYVDAEWEPTPRPQPGEPPGVFTVKEVLGDQSW